MACTLQCGGLRTIRDECANDPCLAVQGMCGHDDCLRWCCPTSTGSVIGLIVGLLFTAVVCALIVRCCMTRRRRQYEVVIVEQAPGYQQYGSGAYQQVQQPAPYYQQQQQQPYVGQPVAYGQPQGAYGQPQGVYYPKQV